MFTSLHPVSLLSRTYASVTTFYHSFYLIELQTNARARFVKRIPEFTADSKSIEGHIRQFIEWNGFGSLESRERTGSFVLNIFDGAKRYFAFYWIAGPQLFVAVSSQISASFTKELLNLICHESAKDIPLRLLTLSTLPISPGPGMLYDHQLSNGTASLSVSVLELVEDSDMNRTAMYLLNPMMLVEVWEALLLDQSVLVTHSTGYMATLCCEFLRLLVLPLPYNNVFQSALPSERVPESTRPGATLIGVSTLVLGQYEDLSEQVLVDLDQGRVKPSAEYKRGTLCRASVNMIAKLVNELAKIMVKDGPSAPSPEMAAKVLHVFKRTNLELLSARTCTAHSFCRYAFPNIVFLDSAGGHSSGGNPASINALSGFQENEFGLCSGYLQLVSIETTGTVYLPCWVEMDKYVLSVYQQLATDLPVLYTVLTDIRTVSPCPIAPDGHVFEIAVEGPSTFRFQATDTMARYAWIQALERYMFDSNDQISSPDGTSGSASSKSAAGSSRSNKAAPSTGSGTEMVTVWDGYRLIERPRYVGTSGKNSDSGSNPGSAQNSGHGGAFSAQAEFHNVGFPQPCPSQHSEAYAALVQQDYRFRLEVTRTSSVYSFFDHMECSTFQSVFAALGIKCEDLLGPQYVLDAKLNIAVVPVGPPEKHANRGAQSDRSRALPPAVDPAEPLTRSNRWASFAALPAGSFGSFSARSVKPRSNSLFGSIFGRTLSPEQQALMDAAQHHEEAKLRDEQELLDSKVKALQSRIMIAAGLYRRLQADINHVLVQERLIALQGLTEARSKDFFSIHSKAAKQATVTYSLTDLLPSHRDTAPEPRATPTVRNAIDTPPNNIETVESAAPKTLPELVWRALTGQSYADYCRDHPFVASADEFIVDERRAAADKEHLHSIRERLLADLLRQHHRSFDQKIPDLCVAPRAALIGYLHEALHRPADALVYYSKGSLVEQSRLMHCLVQQLLMVLDGSEPLCESLSPPAPRAASHDTSSHATSTPLERLLGSQASTTTATTPDPVLRFLEKAAATSTLVGLQAKRLVVELHYRNLMAQLCALTGKPSDQQHHSLSLGSFRTISGSVSNVANAGLQSTFDRVKALSLQNSDFDCTVNEKRKLKVLNDAVSCTAIHVQRTPWELSIMLIMELREIIKLHCHGAQGSTDCTKDHQTYKLNLTSATIASICAMSAFKAFERNCCILQAVDLAEADMTTNERVLFWCNIYNTLSVHAVLKISEPKPVNPLDRAGFMSKAKYNIGQHAYSLEDMELRILRSKSAKPNVFGPLSPQYVFQESDPRAHQVLDAAFPNISFVLCTTCASSPALVVLKNPARVHDDLHHYANRYLRETVQVRSEGTRSVVLLPEVVMTYSADFGADLGAMLATLTQLAPRGTFAAVSGAKVKLEKWVDWKPMLSIDVMRLEDDSEMESLWCS